MDWDILLQFIDPRLLIVGVVLYAVGAMLKLWEGFTKEWMIPYILWGLAIILTMLVLAVMFEAGFTAEVALSGVIQGTLLAALAVFANQMIKQFSNRKIE